MRKTLRARFSRSGLAIPSPPPRPLKIYFSEPNDALFFYFSERFKPQLIFYFFNLLQCLLYFLFCGVNYLCRSCFPPKRLRQFLQVFFRCIRRSLARKPRAKIFGASFGVALHLLRRLPKDSSFRRFISAGAEGIAGSLLFFVLVRVAHTFLSKKRRGHSPKSIVGLAAFQLTATYFKRSAACTQYNFFYLIALQNSLYRIGGFEK